MQLFRRAFTSRICDRRLFHPSLYIPGTVFTIPSIFELPLPPLETADQPSTTFHCQERNPLESKKKEEEIFLHTRWGVIVRHNVTNFQLLRGSPSLPLLIPQTLPERAFKSSTKPPLPLLLLSDSGGSTLAKGTAMGWDGVPPFSTKHGRPPRSPGDRFFPRTIYSFTFYSHRAFDNSWMAEDKLVSPSPIIFPFLSAPGGDVVGWFEERSTVFSRVVRACCFFVNFFLIIFFFSLERILYKGASPRLDDRGENFSFSLSLLKFTIFIIIIRRRRRRSERN